MNNVYSMDGLTEAWLLDGIGGGNKLDGNKIASSKFAPNEWLWLHFNYSKPAVQEWMRENSGLSGLTAEALLQTETRPRCESADHGLMVILRGVNLNPGADPEDMVSIRIWVDKQRIISLGMRHLLSIDDMVDVINRGRGPRNPSDFLIMLLDNLLDRASNVIENLSDAVDELDDSILTASSLNQRECLLDIRRQTITLRRFLAPQREALSRLTSEKTTILTDKYRLYIREDADRLTRLIEDLDAVRERSSVIHESLVSRIAEQTNYRIYILSIIAAMFLPLSFVTGLLGINVGGIPGAQSELGFAAVMALIAIVAGGLWAFFRWRRWF